MRTIVVGDVQGCLQELRQLMDKVEYQPGADRLILAGDLVDRGPDPGGVVRYAMEVGAEAVLGNHEETHLRYRKHARDQPLTNPMASRMVLPDFKKTQYALGDAEWEWLGRRPYWLHVNDRWSVVHAGCRPGIDVERQDPRVLSRMRYIRKADRSMAPLREKMLPDTHAFWTDLWDGPRSIVYGHHADKRGAVLTVNGKPQRFPEGYIGFLFGYPYPEIKPAPVYTIGLDTGCCYGGMLSAAIFRDTHVEVTSVPATGRWADLKHEYGLEDR